MLPHQRTKMEGYLLPVLLGLIVLARIDTLPFALLALIFYRQQQWLGWRRALCDFIVFCLIFGWWFFLNLAKTGTPIPSSGLAYQRGTVAIDIGININTTLETIAASTHFGRIINILVRVLNLHSIKLYVVGCVTSVILLFMGYAMVHFRRTNRVKFRAFCPVLIPLLVYMISIVVFYTFFFGAPWFISRYMSPIMLFFNLLEVCCVILVIDFFFRKIYKFRRVVNFMITIGLISLYFIFVRNLIKIHLRPVPITTYVDHYQIVKDLPSNTVIGSFQSGVLSYFATSTIINLDGKMNVDAVRAIRSGILYDYVCSKRIEYIVDWPFLIAKYFPPCFFNDYTKVRTISRGIYTTTLWKLK